MIPQTSRVFAESRDEQARRTGVYTQRVLALVKAVPGMKCAEIARATRTPPATCQMILKRAEASGTAKAKRRLATGPHWYPADWELPA